MKFVLLPYSIHLSSGTLLNRVLWPLCWEPWFPKWYCHPWVVVKINVSAKAWTLKNIPIPPSCWSHSPNFFPSFHCAVQKYELTKVDSFLQNEWNIFPTSIFIMIVSTTNWQLPRALLTTGQGHSPSASMEIEPCAAAAATLTRRELRVEWGTGGTGLYRFLDSWIFSGNGCVITILASPHI